MGMFFLGELRSKRFETRYRATQFQRFDANEHQLRGVRRIVDRLVPKLSFRFEQSADLSCDDGQAARRCSFE